MCVWRMMTAHSERNQLVQSTPSTPPCLSLYPSEQRTRPRRHVCFPMPPPSVRRRAQPSACQIVCPSPVSRRRKRSTAPSRTSVAVVVPAAGYRRARRVCWLPPAYRCHRYPRSTPLAAAAIPRGARYAPAQRRSGHGCATPAADGAASMPHWPLRSARRDPAGHIVSARISVVHCADQFGIFLPFLYSNNRTIGSAMVNGVVFMSSILFIFFAALCRRNAGGNLLLEEWPSFWVPIQANRLCG